MNVSLLTPFRFSKRAVVFFATLTPGGAFDFAPSPILSQAPVFRAPLIFAQEEAPEWDAFLERRDGWLAADGIYSLDLGRDVADENAVKVDANPPTSQKTSVATPRKTLFLFSDTFGGSTKNAGRDFDEIKMSNHSFAVLTGAAPNDAVLEPTVDAERVARRETLR